MPRLPAKYKNSSHEAEIKLYKQWSLAVTPISIYTVKVIDDIFKTMKRIIANKINFETGNDQRLSSYDEKIYQFYRELMDVYNNLSKNSYQNDALFDSETVTTDNIWSGIFAVIQSRVKLFEENTAQLGGFLTEINPVIIEKKDIMSKSLRTFAESFNNTAQRFKIEAQKKLILFAVKNLIYNDNFDSGVIYNNVLEEIKNNCLKMFYDFYGATVQFAIINLNDLYKRRDTHYYYELLMEEQQILSSIINIQVAVLEQELAKKSSETEKSGVFCEPITILKQAHEQLNFKVEEINLLFKSTEDKDKSVESYEEFCEIIVDKLSESDIIKVKAFNHSYMASKSNYNFFLKDLEELSYKNAQRNIKKLNLKSSMYECSKLAFEHELLVGEIIDEFIKIIDFYEMNKGLYETAGQKEDQEIIKGIVDTVAIKIESLKERKTALTADMTELLSKFSSSGPEFSDAERLQYFEDFKERLVAQLLSCLNEDKLGSTVVRAFCASEFSDDVIKQYSDKAARISEKNLETLNKKLLAFKKDSLLFEISTFEEILNYSVSILRKSADDVIIDFVKNIDDNTKRLMNILAKYNIEIIKPEPHEPFNGKEHDVLMAETKDDFKKGEIIKVMNCGYKQNDVVILRANVIAAR